MKYADFSEIDELYAKIKDYTNFQSELCTEKSIETVCSTLKQTLSDTLDNVLALPHDFEKAKREPNEYDKIIALAEGGNERVAEIKDLKKRMTGALIGRFAGCTLGVPVENRSIEDMREIARFGKMDFPPTDYWTVCETPWKRQYEADERTLFLKDGITAVPVDDDLTYTILGLLIMEKYGLDFSTQDVAHMWKEHLPIAWTAERVALENIKNGISAYDAADINNPYSQWIGADIRADGFAYCCAGDPHMAAKLGYKDAYLSHRRNGIYGEMFFGAAIAAAFCTDDPIDAIKTALKEIPKECELYRDIVWALSVGEKVTDYITARKMVDERFANMSSVHTNNNACLVVFALMMNRDDFNKAISDTVAMGLDNDCTAATVGSIMGASLGIDAISPHWYKCFNNTVRTYIMGYPEFRIDDLVERFINMRAKIFNC